MSRLEALRDLLESREARVGVVGLGYVGLPLAVELARAGFRVTGFDLDEEKVRKVQAGQSYIEDVPGAGVRAMVDAGRLTAETGFDALSESDVINVCVPTPLTKTRDPDVSYIIRAVAEIRERIRPGQLIILGSTTYPGTTHELFVSLLEESGLRCGEDFAVAFAPERIDPGNRDFAVHEVPKVVGGETPLATELGCKLFESVFDRIVPVSSTQSAEMVKLLENTFRAINIGLANEVALMCDRLGLDVWEVIEAAATKPYGFMRFQPGPGLGGHCIPVDPTYLASKMKTLSFIPRIVEAATEINGQMPAHVADTVADLLNQDRLAVNGSNVLILGVAYKRDISDMRETPALDIIRLLEAKGAEIHYHDPHVPKLQLDERTLESESLSGDVLEKADVVVIVTDHSAVDYADVVARAKRVYDTRNATRDVSDGKERVRKL